MIKALRIMSWRSTAVLMLSLPLPALAAATLWQLQATPPAGPHGSQPAATAPARYQQILQQGQLLTPDLDALDQLNINDTISLPLPEGEVSAVVKAIKHHSAQSYSIIAIIQQGKEQLPVVITRGPTGFYGRLVTANQTYAIRGDVKQSRLLPEQQLNDQLDFTKPDALELPTNLPAPSTPANGQDPTAHLSNHPENQPHSVLAPAAAAGKELYPPLTDTTTAVVDVLMVYSPAAAALYQGDIQTRLHHLVAVTNKIYQDSGVHLEMRAAAMREVPVQATDSYRQLDEITDKTNAFVDLEQWRYEAGADLVALFTPRTETGICGVAWLATSQDDSGQIQYVSRNLISLTHITCGDYVLAHEAGHNMGLVHSEKQGDVGKTFPFARGYGVDNSFATVMAYEGAFNASKIYQFSNPLLQCNGVPCGIERHDPHGADATYAINAIRFGLQDLYQPEPNLLTYDEAVAQLSDAGLKSCLQQVKSSRPELQYAGQLTSLGGYNSGNNCNGFGPILSLAGLAQFSNINDVYLSSHRITDFSELGKLTQLKKLTLSGNISIRLDWLNHLTKLTTLNLYNYGFIDATPLASLQNLTTLDLTNNYTLSFAPIQQLTKLRELTLRPNLSSSDKLAEANWLSSLTELSRLTLTSSRLSQTQMLGALGQLEELTLGSNQPLNIDGLASLPALTSLDLSSSNQLDCASAYQTWRGLQQLRTFQLPGHCKTTDVTAPVFGELPALVIEATAKKTPVTLQAPIARDNIDGDIPAKTYPRDGYAVGDHMIWWEASDFNGNVGSARQALTVRDSTPPTLTGPDEAGIITYDTQGAYRYSNEWTDFLKLFSATDRVDGVLNISHPEQLYWPLGVHQLPMTATDSAGNSVSRTVQLVVNYHYGPTFTAPATVTLPSPGPAGLPATDSRVQQIIAQVKATEFFNNQPLTVTADYPAQLLPGKNMFIFSATDDYGYKNSYLLPVFLTDQQLPVLTVPEPLKLTADSSGIAITDPRIVQFLQSASATDNFDTAAGSQVVINYNLPARFLPGVTAVLFTATDSSGNKVSANGYVEVVLSKRQNRLLKLLLMAPRQ